jgi:hypothetical protein
MTFVPLIYIALIIASVYNWKRHNNVRFYWLIYPLSLMVIISVASHTLKTMFSFGLTGMSVMFYISSILRDLAFIAFVAILLKKNFRMDRDKFGRIINFPTTKKDGYYLTDIANLAKENSDDLTLPEESEIKGLSVGDAVKLQFNTITNTGDDSAVRERMWVVIEAIEPTYYIGRLYNTSVARVGPRKSLILKFQSQNILDIHRSRNLLE